jgi:hypothetical protein
MFRYGDVNWVAPSPWLSSSVIRKDISSTQNTDTKAKQEAAIKQFHLDLVIRFSCKNSSPAVRFSGVPDNQTITRKSELERIVHNLLPTQATL